MLFKIVKALTESRTFLVHIKNLKLEPNIVSTKCFPKVAPMIETEDTVVNKNQSIAKTNDTILIDFYV